MEEWKKIQCGNDIFFISDILDAWTDFQYASQRFPRKKISSEKIILHLLLKNGIGIESYIQGKCGFDIFEKEREIKQKLEEYYKEQDRREKDKQKVENSNNRGEQDVEYHIKWILKSLGKYVVAIDGNCESKYRYNCILLKNSLFIDEAQEYDHILVTPSGIVLIETKDWKGAIDITTDGKWIRHKEDGTPYGVASPIVQMRRHEQLLKSILDSVPVYSIICFSNPSAIINGKRNINECLIINIEQLEETLKQICSNMNYSNQEINDMVDTIESFKVRKQKDE